jgi:PhnB protein
MNSHLQFDFNVNKNNNTIEVKRAFAADIEFVWATWTKAELLDQWWAPKPWKCKTLSMDFREGGRWHYAMIGPKGEKQHCVLDYNKITTAKHFSGIDAFCDEQGNINNTKPRVKWKSMFHQQLEKTLVELELIFETLEDLEAIIKMGFKEGFTMGLQNLDQYIEAQFKLRNAYKNDNKTRVCTYLNFPGNTEEAFLFYKSVFKSEFTHGGIQRFGDLPANPAQTPVADHVKKMVLHVELPIIGQHILMGTDAPKEMGFTITTGNNMHISLEPDNRAEAKRIFDELSEGGKISMPLQDMFWGAYFGSFTDKYGVNWMVNCLIKENV